MKRNFGLDLLRTISIWLVLLQHGGINIPGLHPLKIGGIGVEIFFVLSGFLIGGILFKDIDDKLSFKTTLTRFWVRRWFRILPLYYLMLILKFILIDHSIGWNIIYYFFFLQNNFYGIQFFDVSWSLVIEEWFYLFAPVYLILSTRILKTEKKIFASLILIILLVIVARAGYVWKTNVPYSGINGNFPFRFDSLFLGVTLAFLRYKNWSLFNRLKSPLVFMAGLTVLISYVCFYRAMSFPVYKVDASFFLRTFGFFILPFAVALMIPRVSAINLDFKQSYFKRAMFEIITVTSILTYAVYLVHPFIFSVVFADKYAGYGLLQWPFAIGLTYLCAWCLYTFFEKPILSFRNRLTHYHMDAAPGDQHTG